MVALQSVFLKDVALAYRQRAELMQPLMFFVLVITLFPLAIGPSPETLQRIGGGVIWVAAILSLLLGMERMFRDDFADGSLEQYMLSPTPLYLIVVVKVLTHWLMHIVPLFLISPLLALFLNLTFDMYVALMLTLLLGTPLISFIGGIGVALTVGLHRGGVLLALLLIPIFIPLLIFATSAIESASMLLPYHAQLAIIAALLLFSVALSPMAIAYSLKVSQN
ncbi:heme exporter protein CcmB [Glaciecola sp. 33A]|jgi:heme exporter protein B|uniref:heme exporter protein CcmB n=1 Tax=Glaciecola sp. 33A TaxID=2057807 RepID=UPI000C328781|nr:heme exporter protein CcmB [Glaciecola sp. 33A]PKI02309.1 heme exporter protein CcmB [Glaciecola sp. 33A]